MRKNKIFIFNNNRQCEGRGLDASRLARYFGSNNCDIVKKPKIADYIILFTCAYNNVIEEQNLELIDKFKRYKYKGELIVAGCLPEIAPEKLKKIFKGRSVVTKNLCEIDRIFAGFKTKFFEVPDANKCLFSPSSVPAPLSIRIKESLIPLRKLLKQHEFSKLFYYNCLRFAKNNLISRISLIKTSINKIRREENAYSILRIGTGCLGNCSYCGIRNAIGRLKSKPLDDCLKEYRKLLEMGHRDFEIGSEDTGAYGLDLNSSLPELLDKMSGMDKSLEVSWFVVSLKPLWMLKYKSELLKIIKEGKIKYLECPVQSGSERILKLMNRYSNIKEIVATLLEFKNAYPDIGLITHIIVGFPSEIEDDFFATMDMIKKVNFRVVLPFLYCDKEMSMASTMNGKLDEETIDKRLDIIGEYMEKAGISSLRPTCPS